MKELFPVGFILVLIGILLIFLSALSTEGKTKFAVFGFIGPIPFGFANSGQLLKIAVICTIIGAIIFLLFLKFYT